MPSATEATELRFTATVELDLTAALADVTKPIRISILGYGGGLMNVPRFGAAIVDLSGTRLPASLPLLVDHDNTLNGVVGSGVPTIRDGKLFIEGTLVRSATATQKILDLAAGGVSFQASVGLEISERQFIKAGEKLFANGRNHVATERGFSFVKAGVLREISIVSIGADDSTTVTIAANRKGKKMSTEVVNDQVVDSDQKTLEVLQAERLRCAGILREATGFPELQATAISENWTPAKAALETMRVARPSTPSFAYTQRRGSDADFLTASLSINAGVPEAFVGEQFNEQVMNAAVSAQGRRIGIHDVLRAVAASAGRHLPPGRLSGADVREAFEANLQLRASGFSTLSIPGILGGATGKSLLSAYQAAGGVARQICRAASLPDFKSGHTAYKMTGSGMVEQVGPAGELKHTTLSEASYANSLATYGKLLSITRRDIINDDLGAFGEVPRLLGRQAALAVEDAVFTLLLGNAGTFFGTGNGNYIEGASTNLQLSSLDSLTQKFADQVDADG